MMTNEKILVRSSTGLTDFLHILALAVPIFLILVGSYILYEDLIANVWWRAAVLLGLLASVALLAPLGSRLKHVEILENNCRVLSSHTDARSISFGDVEQVSIIPIIGIIRMKLQASRQLPSDSVWFIPRIDAPESHREGLQRIRSFLEKRCQR
jgi:hypothetical protein